MGASECCHVKRVVPEVASRPTEPWHTNGDNSTLAPEADAGGLVLEELHQKGRSETLDGGLSGKHAISGKVLARSSTGEERETRSQAQRVEDNDETDFVRGWDIATRVVALLDGQDFGADMATKSLRGSLVPCDAGGGGLSLQFPITFEEAETLRFHYIRYGASKGLRRSIATELLQQFVKRHEQLRQSAVVDAEMPCGPEGKLIVVGDTHGQLQDVLFIFHAHGPPTAQNVYVFNGDIADRGSNSCEIFFLLCAYFLAEPASVIINRGNHENEDMNALEAHCGGGFRKEVLTKYDHTMYVNFLMMMKALPICTVVGKKVLVVHGGLSRHTNMKLDDIRALDHTNRTMPDPFAQAKEEQLWVDLLWADPMDENGIQESQRGVGIKFGPDITAKFLRDNSPLEYMIRSHQLPDNDRGFMKQAGERCVTIFSASNYCGDTGNHGAVLVFQSKNFPECEIHEHYAPTLEELVHRKDWKEAGQALKERHKAHNERVRKSQELYKMMAAIMQLKPQIWTHFLDSTGGLLWIEYAEWVRILSNSIGSDWSWEAAWNDWNLGDHQGRVNFRSFLERFTVSLSNEGITSFKFRVITSVYESIMNSQTSLQETLRLFDQDGDGMVDIHEMRAVLGRFDLSLSHAQLDSLLYTLFIDNDTFEEVPKIAVTEFLERFTLVYKEAGGNFTSASRHDEQEALVNEAMSKIGHLIAATPCEELQTIGTSKTLFARLTAEGTAFFSAKSEPNQSKRISKQLQAMKSGPLAVTGVLISAKLRSLFEALDADHNGLLEIDEFVRGISRMPGIFQIKLSNGKSINEDLIRQLGTHMGRRGRVSILELLEAFCFEDAGGEKMSDCLAEQILAVLFRHRQPVRAGAWCFDRMGRGFVLKEEFIQVLRTLNRALDDAGENRQHLMESQVIHLCEALSVEDDEGSAIIRYEEFFDSFEIVDRENPSLRIKLGHRIKK
mmetsp:Transcript_125019/g.241110  ORF Transcript_125019/g.241110 Transcript_125019/m.241110 type:complete len:955 (+) Transcript_125019:91-2955(+)